MMGAHTKHFNIACHDHLLVFAGKRAAQHLPHLTIDIVVQASKQLAIRSCYPVGRLDKVRIPEIDAQSLQKVDYTLANLCLIHALLQLLVAKLYTALGYGLLGESDCLPDAARMVTWYGSY